MFVKNKDRIFLVITALVLTIAIFVSANILWKDYDFRLFVCTKTNGKYCYNIRIGPPPEGTRAYERYMEWKKNNPGKML